MNSLFDTVNSLGSNTLLWIPEVLLAADHCRKGKYNAAANFAIMGRLAPNILNLDKSPRRGTKRMGMKAA
jgi:hypothetical protein